MNCAVWCAFFLALAVVVLTATGCNSGQAANLMPQRLEVGYEWGEGDYFYGTTAGLYASNDWAAYSVGLGWDLYVPTRRVLPDPALGSPRAEVSAADGNSSILATIERHWVVVLLLLIVAVAAGLGPVVLKRFGGKQD